MNGEWKMVNEVKGLEMKNDLHVARQINDFETHTYAKPETTLIFLQPFIENKNNTTK